MKQFYIYLTINKVNNKKYIGQHYGEINDNYLGSGKLLKRAFSKYGKENFKKEILYIAKDEEELNLKEKYYIQKYNAVKDNNFYNLIEGGSVHDAFEKKNKISSKLSGDKHPLYGKHLSEDTKAKLSQSLKKYWTKDKRKAQSEKYKGEKNPMYGKKHSEETIKKMVQNNDFTSYRTEEYRKKMSEATSGKKNGNYGNKDDKAKNGKKVYMYDENYTLVKTFNTKQMALKYLKMIGHTQLDKAIKNNSIYKGFYWKQD